VTLYVRLTADKTQIEKFNIELTAEQYDGLGAWKQSFLRLWSVDPQPAYDAATQRLDIGAVVIDATTARRTWSVIDKTAGELAAEAEDVALAAEQAKVVEILADLVTQRDLTRATWDAYTANQLRAEQWRDRQVLLRVAHYLMRRVKQQAPIAVA
jgi:hypothetical protein